MSDRVSLAMVHIHRPTLGAYLAEKYDNEAVFLASILLIAIDLTFIAMILPESLGAGDDHQAIGEGGYEGRSLVRGGGLAPGGAVSMAERKRGLNYGDDFMAVLVKK